MGFTTESLKQRLTGTKAGHLGPLLDLMARNRQSSKAGIYAFTSARTGDGVSFVVVEVAQELARLYQTDVLILTAAELMRFFNVPLQRDARMFSEWSPRVWRPYEAALARDPIPQDQIELILNRLRSWTGGYVLVDCPSIEEGGFTLPVASRTDGVLLTVAAGQTDKHGLEAAGRTLRNAQAPVLGLILNKRTYAIPESVYRWI